MPAVEMHPSDDRGATALAIAHEIYNFAQYNDKGGYPDTIKGKEELAKKRVDLIAAAAKQLYEAVKL